MNIFESAKGMAQAAASRARSIIDTATRRKPQTDELRHAAGLGAALESAADSQGWKALMTQLHGRREAIINEILHGEPDKRNALAERAAEIDSVFKWIDDSAEAGKKAHEELQRAGE